MFPGCWLEDSEFLRIPEGRKPSGGLGRFGRALPFCTAFRSCGSKGTESVGAEIPGMLPLLSVGGPTSEAPKTSDAMIMAMFMNSTSSKNE
jgi:hypothetical protein